MLFLLKVVDGVNLQCAHCLIGSKQCSFHMVRQGANYSKIIRAQSSKPTWEAVDNVVTPTKRSAEGSPSSSHVRKSLRAASNVPPGTYTLSKRIAHDSDEDEPRVLPSPHGSRRGSVVNRSAVLSRIQETVELLDAFYESEQIAKPAHMAISRLVESIGTLV
jgi:hypothetical protein